VGWGGVGLQQMHTLMGSEEAALRLHEAICRPPKQSKPRQPLPWSHTHPPTHPPTRPPADDGVEGQGPKAAAVDHVRRRQLLIVSQHPAVALQAGAGAWRSAGEAKQQGPAAGSSA
jgi:hypothetical protein